MASIFPFKALRPAAQYAKGVASRPYDVLDAKEAKEETVGKPNSFLHITRSEIDLPKNTDPYSSEVYKKAKENLDAFIGRGVLFDEDRPCYYIYELEMDGRKQTGLVCCSSVDDYEKGIIRKHELTRPKKEQDRINHISVTKAQTGNVFLAYRDDEELNQIIENWKSVKSPVYSFVLEDGVAHAVWVLSDQNTIERITEIFKSRIPNTYIADGHHRAASAAKVKDLYPELAQAKYFLTTLFPAGQLKILDYNRVLRNINGGTPEQFLERIRENFDILKKTDAYKPTQPHHFGLYMEGNWYELIAKEGTFENDPVGILDVTVLQNNMLGPILGIVDQRTDDRIDFVGGIKGMNELKRQVDEGRAVAAISIFPVTIDQLFDIADNNLLMPPKSTWFEPKLRDGLLTHLI